ncbi:MAG: hypothetical protein LBV71_17345 [Prevotella sp.]|jgi:hypothetical protein|nr:hypothetical protein [Prevotella sp.]
MKIKFTQEALGYFKELSTILYEEEYFGFEDSALRYVDTLVRDIIDKLPRKQKRIAPPYFEKYGDKLLFSTFRRNKNTQWYVFFNLYEDEVELIYLVRYISNNHLIAQYL